MIERANWRRKNAWDLGTGMCDKHCKYERLYLSPDASSALISE